MTRTQKLLGMFAATAICLPALAQSGSNSNGDPYPTQNRSSQYQAGQSQAGHNRASSTTQERNRQTVRNQRDRMSNGQGSSQMQRQPMNDRGMGSNRRSEATNSSQTLTGTIRSIERFNLTGVNGERAVARVETESGNHVAVILGPTNQVNSFNLRQGDQVTLRCNRGSIDGRHVLVADRIRAGDRTHRVENRKVDDLKRISGEIVSTKTRELNSRNGQPTEHKLVKVKESNGRTCVVSLGPISDTDQRRLRKGEDVSVLASPTKVNGHTVYSARRVSHNGQTMNLASSSTKMKAKGSSSQMLTGTIRSMKDFNLNGVDGKRRVARVETENGDQIAVLLGPTNQVNSFDFSAGDRMTLGVNRGSIDGRHVFVADRIRSGDKTHRVENRKVDDLKRISGEIVSTRTRELNARNGQPTEHKLVKVKESNGRTCVVSLGPISDTDQMRLGKGEKVCVLASPTKVNGHTVYSARRVSHDGQTKNLATIRSSMDRDVSQN